MPGQLHFEIVDLTVKFLGLPVRVLNRFEKHIVRFVHLCDDRAEIQAVCGAVTRYSDLLVRRFGPLSGSVGEIGPRGPNDPKCGVQYRVGSVRCFIDGKRLVPLLNKSSNGVSAARTYPR